jgi:hypothetical protein
MYNYIYKQRLPTHDKGEPTEIATKHAEVKIIKINL